MQLKSSAIAFLTERIPISELSIAIVRMQLQSSISITELCNYTYLKFVFLLVKNQSEGPVIVTCHNCNSY